MTYQVFIPRWHPATVNQIYAGHWSKRRKLKAADRQMIEVYIQQAKIPPATGKRRLTLTIMLPPARRAADPDSYHKSACDGLVHCGALQNDSHKWVELAPVVFRRATAVEWGTQILLEEIG